LPKKTTYFVLVYVILIYLNSSVAAQTTTVGGVINQYARVTTIVGNVVTLSSVAEAETMFGTPFLPGRRDTVLLIQMTGVPNLGNVNKGAGRYEFHIVTNVSGATVTLRSAIDQSDATFLFDPVQEIVQMIRVSSYKNALIDTELTCETFQWASGTGGVLALFVQDTLTFNADINVSGRGFNGGKSYNPTATVICIPPSPSHANLLPTSDLAGNKGEGVIEKRIYDNTPKGYAKTWNGGGGGIGRWSGGGGGANGNDGGSGGDQYCGIPGWVLADGNNGYSIKYNELNNISKYAYMGGGGGAGTGVDGTDGGNGGGIVMIVARNMKFKTGTEIRAAGNSVAGEPSEAGAGGGGGGGSVLLSVKNYGKIKVDISGGNGGNVYSESTNCITANTGVGGGGSGGFLITMDSNTSRSWYEKPDTLNRSNGRSGRIITSTLPNCYGYQQDGNPGMYRSGFKIQLKGFLNNYIFAPDMVCYDEYYNDPVTIWASDPLGGTDDYLYEWYSSSDGLNWKMIENANERDLAYRFTEDIWLQRKVTSGDEIDYSLPVMIKVHDRIINRIIQDDAFCREDQITIGGEKITGGGGSSIHDYAYQWEELKGTTWSEVDHTINDQTEVLSLLFGNNPTNVLNLKYRRTVTSKSGCRSVSNTSSITIHRSIEGNEIDGNMERVCEDISLLFTAPKPTGGNETDYRYEWQIKEGDHDWIPAPGVNNGKDYTPGTGDGNRLFRRFVASGKCNNGSKPVEVNSIQQAEILTNPTTLNLQFKMDLNAVKPKLGSGLWSSSNEQLKFIPNPPNIPNVKVEDMKEGNYTFYWTVTNGECVSKTSVEIIVIDFFFPKGFSPNGDNYNNCFRIKGAENAKLSKIVIFDRYNNIVFENDRFGKDGNSNYENNTDCKGWWDGCDKSGKELPSGVYYYRYTFRLEEDMNDKIYNGHVVLRR